MSLANMQYHHSGEDDLEPETTHGTDNWDQMAHLVLSVCSVKSLVAKRLLRIVWPMFRVFLLVNPSSEYVTFALYSEKINWHQAIQKETDCVTGIEWYISNA